MTLTEKAPSKSVAIFFITSCSKSPLLSGQSLPFERCFLPPVPVPFRRPWQKTCRPRTLPPPHLTSKTFSFAARDSAVCINLTCALASGLRLGLSSTLARMSRLLIRCFPLSGRLQHLHSFVLWDTVLEPQIHHVPSSLVLMLLSSMVNVL